MDKLPKVAVLLAAFNGEKYIKEQIESILKQKEVSVKIFISIDKSTDKTLDIVNRLRNNIDNIDLLPYGQSYGSAGMNFFRLITEVEFSSFDFISLSDQDDIWMDDKLSTACSYLYNKKASGYSSDVLAFWEDGKERIIKKTYPQKKWDYLFEAGGPGCTYVLTKNLGLKIKEEIKCIPQADLIKIFIHDWFIYAYARANNLKWVFGKTIHVRYRQHSDNSLGANTNLKSLKKRYDLIKSGWFKNQTFTLVKVLKIRAAEEELFTKPLRLNLLISLNQLRRKRLDRLYLLLIICLGFFN